MWVVPGQRAAPVGRDCVSHLHDARVAQHAVSGHPQPLVLAAGLHLSQGQRSPRGSPLAACHVAARVAPHRDGGSRGWGRRRGRGCGTGHAGGCGRGAGRVQPRISSSSPTALRGGNGGAPSPSNHRHTPLVRHFARSGWERFLCCGGKAERRGRQRGAVGAVLRWDYRERGRLGGCARSLSGGWRPEGPTPGRERVRALGSCGSPASVHPGATQRPVVCVPGASLVLGSSG